MATDVSKMASYVGARRNGDVHIWDPGKGEESGRPRKAARGEIGQGFGAQGDLKLLCPVSNISYMLFPDHFLKVEC